MSGCVNVIIFSQNISNRAIFPILLGYSQNLKTYRRLTGIYELNDSVIIILLFF